MAKKSRTVVRSSKTGRFVKKVAAERHPSTTVVETVVSASEPSKKKLVRVVRSTKTGRFLKNSAAKRRPDVAKVDTVER